MARMTEMEIISGMRKVTAEGRDVGSQCVSGSLSQNIALSQWELIGEIKPPYPKPVVAFTAEL